MMTLEDWRERDAELCAEIERLKAEAVTREPPLNDIRCDHCKYWVHGDQWGTDMHYGSCHRNAPPGILGQWHYEVLKMLWLIAGAAIGATKDDKDHDWEMHWEEATEQASEWPQTVASDWCGEFKQGERHPNPNLPDVAPDVAPAPAAKSET